MENYINSFTVQVGDAIIVKVRAFNEAGPGSWSEAPWGTFVENVKHRRNLEQQEVLLLATDFDREAFEI